MNSKVLAKSDSGADSRALTGEDDRSVGNAQGDMPESGGAVVVDAAVDAAPISPPQSGVRLKDHFTIWPEAALAHLDAPCAPAFGATDLLTKKEGFFALVCDGSVVPRGDLMPKLREIRCPELLQLVDWGTVAWPGGQDPGQRRLAVIYERPVGDRLVEDMNAVLPPISEDDAMRHILAPAVTGLLHLARYGIIHRAIRPTNMFYRDGTRQSIMLGDCVTTPPAYAQPALFEAIESAMASPAGRGTGVRRNDVYSLGVTLLFLLLGHRPAQGLDDEALLAARVTDGSYATLLGKNSIPVELREPLRGMLNDDPEQRWELEDLEKWLSDRRIRPAHRLQTPKAARPFAFEGRNFYTCRSLSLALTRQWRSDYMIERKAELVAWIERSQMEGPRPEAIDRVYEQVSTGGSPGSGSAITTTALFNARLALALDPKAPLRYKGFSAMIDGMGSALAAGFNDTARLQEFVEIVRSGLVIFWIDLLRFGDPDVMRTAGVFRRLSNFLKDSRAGYGIERCLYELNIGQYCLSPLIDRDYVVTINELLPALDRAAVEMRDGTPFDRHVAAFIAARFVDDVTGPLGLAAHRENPLDATVGLLALLATLQWRLGPAALPELTRWVAGSSQPLIATYHHRAARKRVETELPALTKAGSLVNLYSFLVNSDMRRQDETGFAAAVEQYAKIDFEIAFLESGGASDPARARRYGQQIAAACSTALGLFAILILTVVKL